MYYNKSSGSCCVINMYYFIHIDRFMSQRIVMELNCEILDYDQALFPAQSCYRERISKLS